MDTPVKAALSYAASGWPNFPCSPGSKVPLYVSPHPIGSPERKTCRGECGKFGHGVYDGTTDPEVIEYWYARVPEANVAVATGAPGPDVVDFDTKHDAPGIATYDRLRAAGLLTGAQCVVVTPSGGWHLYYPGTDQGNGSLARHGIDFRSRGGYVLAPPSVVDGKPYVLHDERPAPGETVDWAAIRAFIVPPKPHANVRHSGGGVGRGLAGLALWLAEQEEGNRNNALYWASCRALEAGHDDLTAIEVAALHIGLPAQMVRQTVESARCRIRGAA